MTNRASQVLQGALTEQARSRSRRAAVYLNVRARTSSRPGRWLSDVGFLSELPFSYAALDRSNSLPDEGGDGRLIERVFLVPYGLTRDLQRLESDLPADMTVRTLRSPGATGLAAAPGDGDYLVPADVGDDGAVIEKTTALLAALRTADSGVGYHAVVTRAGAVYVCAPLDETVHPVPGAESAVCVAVEGLGRRARTPGARAEAAPPTDPQLRSLAALIAKVGSAYLNLDVTLGTGVQYVVRPDEPVARALPSPIPAAFDDLVRREGLYDAATEIYRRHPPETRGRAEAQTAIGHTDTLGATTLLLGAYADVAAADRSEGMQQVERRRVFVERARVAHQQGDEGAEAAATAAASEQLAPVIPTVENPGPHSYNYQTGLWGDETPG